MRKAYWVAAAILFAACGPFCGPTAFYVASASSDATYTCPEGATQQPYDLHVTIAADNPTSSDVTIASASAEMVVATVHGSWQQPVGFTYSAGNVPFSPARVLKGSKTNVTLTIPSACTNNSKTGTEDNYADYTVRATLVTSAGTFTVTCSNKHRILAK